MTTTRFDTTAARAPVPLSVGVISRADAIHWTVSLVTVIAVLVPLAPVVLQAFADRPLYEAGWQPTLANFGDVFRDAGLATIALNTLYFVAVTTVIAQLVGGFSAILVGRTNMPMRGLIGGVLLWPLFISHLVMAFGWLIMYGPAGYLTLLVKSWIGVEPWVLYSLTGMAVVAGLAQAPLAYLYCLFGTAGVSDASLEDAARTAGAGPWTVLTRVTLPLMRPALLYSASLNLVIGFEMLSIPLLFGEPQGIAVFATYVYNVALNSVAPNFGVLGTFALMMLAVVAGLLLLQNRLLASAHRFETLGGKGLRPKPLDLGRLRWPAFVVMSVLAVTTILIPMGGVALRSVTSFLTPLLPLRELLTFDQYATVFAHEAYVRSIANTIVVSAVGAALGTALALMIGLTAHRSEFRFARSLEMTAMVPRAIPGIVLGLGVLYAAGLLPPLGMLRNTLWILVAAYVMGHLHVAVSVIASPLFRIKRELDASARTAGADWWTTCRCVLLPLLRPAIFSCFALLFILFLKTYVTAIFLFAPGSEVMGSSMLLFWGQGEDGLVAVMATLQILITITFVASMRRVFGVRVYG